MTWRYTVTARPIDVAPLWHVEGDLSAAGFENVRATAGPDGEALDFPTVDCPRCASEFAVLVGGTCETCRGTKRVVSWKGQEVRVRARYKQSEGAILELALAAVREQFREALRFEFEPICIPDRGLRAPEVAAARTPAEKLAAWARVAGVVLPEDAAAKAGALEGDAETVVAEVEARMAALADLAEREPAAV